MNVEKGDMESETVVRRMIGPGEFKVSARDLVGTLLAIDGEAFDEKNILEIRERIHNALYLARKIRLYADEQYDAAYPKRDAALRAAGEEG